MASKIGSRRWMLQLIMQLGSVLLTRCPFWGCFSQLMLYAERAEARRKPDIPVPYLYFDMGAAVLCASFMSFGVKRRWFALGAALQLAISTYAAYIGGYVHYGDWLKVRMYSRTVAIIGGFLVLASGAGELYRRKPRSRSLQSTGQVFLGIYLICVAYSLQHSKEDRLAYLNYLPRGELMIQLFFVLYGILALAFLSDAAKLCVAFQTVLTHMAQALEEQKSWQYRSHTVLRACWGQKQYQLLSCTLRTSGTCRGWSRQQPASIPAVCFQLYGWPGGSRVPSQTPDHTVLQK
uniref:Transmembrane protein 101 n=5 Tax=Euarchontoglires TaxID=314146 RepID=A0A8D2GWQ7_UROPR